MGTLRTPWQALCWGAAMTAASTAWAAPAPAAKPTVAQALALSPVQEDVDYERPTGAVAEKCVIDVESGKTASGWIVRNDANVLLRRFLDTNGDNKVDQWCYYNDGVEVYRDIDANFNGKADQCRWLGNAGTRWGLDRDEDGRLDSWKSISAEEVTAELVAALRDGDAARYKAVLLSSAELAELGLGPDQSTSISKKIAAAATAFSAAAPKQTALGKQAQWLHFVALRPGLIPAGTNGSTRDVAVYENVLAVAQNEGKTVQIQVGTLVRVNDGWRVLDAPSTLAEGQAEQATGLISPANLTRRTTEAPNTAGLSPAAQKLVAELEGIDKQLSTVAPEAAAKLQSQRAGILEKLAEQAATKEERVTWLRQLTDSLSAAAQSGAVADGSSRLKSLYEKLAKADPRDELVPYVKFRYLSAAYSERLSAPKADFAKVQEQWLKDLETFVTDFPTSGDAAEALLQLAIAQEFAGKDEEARTLYAKIISNFPKTNIASKASGAKLRLESEGKAINLNGTTLDGQPFNLAQYQGKTVVIHYWATWCEPCKQDLETLARLQAKYAKSGLALVGINVDAVKEEAQGELAKNRLPWPQLWDTGGLDGRLANQLGVVTLPTMLLIDDKGKVANRNIHASELEAELAKRLK